MSTPRKEFNEKNLESKQSMYSRLSSNAMVQFLINPLSIVRKYPSTTCTTVVAPVVEKKSTPIVVVDSKKQVLLAPLVNIVYQYAGIQNSKYTISNWLNIDQMSDELADNLLYHQEVLNHVFNGEQKQAEALISKNAKVLLVYGDAIDKVGRKIENESPITLAVCRTKDPAMFRMMIPYLETVAGGVETAYEQIKQKFAEKREDKVYDLSPVVKAITTRYNSMENLALAMATSRQDQKVIESVRRQHNLAAVMAKFRQDQKPGIVSDSYCEANVNNLINAYEVAAAHPEWDGAQLQEFTMGVIAPYQRRLPVCIAQAYFRGMTHDDGVRKIGRTTGFKESSDEYHYSASNLGGPFYPANLDLQTGSGIEYAVDQQGRSTRMLSMTIRDEATTLRRYIASVDLELDRLVNQLKPTQQLTL